MAPRKSKSNSSADKMDDVVLPSGGPGSPIDIVFSFDTTGSMSGYIREVKKNVQEVIERLFTDIPNLRIAVFAHGDYCDQVGSYVTKYVDLTNDVQSLCKFVREVKGTGGGDWEECYELVLRQTRRELSWRPGHQRALVMIGDAIPHGPDYNLNTDKIDWKKETEMLVSNLGMHIYAVQCGANEAADFFYKHLAAASGGRHVNLDQLRTVTDLIMAVCYRETGPDFLAAYEKEVRAREGMGFRAELGHMFAALREDEAPSCGGASSTSSSPSSSSSKSPARGRARSSTSSSKPRAVSFAKPKGATTAKPIARATTPARPRATKRKMEETEDADEGERAVKRPRTTPALRPKSRSRHSMVLRRRPRRLGQARRVVKRVRPVLSKSKLDREEVADKDFKLKDLKWSPWSPAMTPTSGMPTKYAGSWIRRRNGPGMRNVNLFGPKTEVAAVYEFAVGTPAGQKHPVMCKMTKGFGGQHWDTYLLSDVPTERQIDRVLRRGCKLYARRAPFRAPVECAGAHMRNVEEMRSLMHKNYDYAWRQHYDPESRRYLHREVVKDDVKISDNPKRH